MKNTTTIMLLISALIFAVLQTFSILYLDGLTIFFSMMTIISYLQDQKE